MSFCSVMNIEEELDEVSHIISKKLDKSIKEIYVVNSMMSNNNNAIIVKIKNKIFYFVQFLPSQYCYRNIDKETDGYIEKRLNIKISDSNSDYHFWRYSTQRFYYKIKN